MLANTGDSLSKELLDFFNKLPEVKEVLSKQAFSKQRQTIKSQLFEDLNHRYLLESYQEHNKKFHGLRLVAVDGSTAEIPNTKQLREHSGSEYKADSEGAE